MYWDVDVGWGSLRLFQCLFFLLRTWEIWYLYILCFCFKAGRGMAVSVRGYRKTNKKIFYLTCNNFVTHNPSQQGIETIVWWKIKIKKCNFLKDVSYVLCFSPSCYLFVAVFFYSLFVGSCFILFYCWSLLSLEDCYLYHTLIWLWNNWMSPSWVAEMYNRNRTS